MSAADTLEVHTLYTSPMPPQSIAQRIFCAAIFAGALSLQTGRAAAADLVLTHARIYSSADAVPIGDGTILIRDGRIAAIGAQGAARVPGGARRIDVHGGTVMAGFWNNHVHLMSPPLLNAAKRSDAELTRELSQMLSRWGFTTVFDTASLLKNTNAIRQRIAAGQVMGPNILTVGDPFYPKGGTPIYIRQFMKDNGFPDEEIVDLPEAVARVHRQIHEGADGVKLFAGAIVGGDIGVLPMPLEQARALVEAAHADGKPVFAHPSNLAGLTVSMDSGVDVLAHTTPMTGPWPADLTARVLAHHMALIPTLTLFEVEAKKFGESDQELKGDLDAAVQQVNAYAKAGGQILFGTDVGYTDAYDTTEEYRLLARALDWRQILQALTTAPAERFGYASRKGRLARGMDADLVVLDGDPAKDVSAFARVRLAIRAGRTIYGH
jgi:imidazolonepropionase-like amidohydrolase